MPEILAKPIESVFGKQAKETFTDWLFSRFFQKPGFGKPVPDPDWQGGYDESGYQVPGGEFDESGTYVGPQQQIGGDSTRGWELSPLPSYPGDLYPNYEDTLAGRISENWQPWDAGTQTIGKLIGGEQLGQTQHLRDWGGFGGPGHSGLVSAAQWGSPGVGGDYAANMAQFGVSAPGVGESLSNLAQFGTTSSSMADQIAPFLTNSRQNRYRAPQIQPRQIYRTEVRP